MASTKYLDYFNISVSINNLVYDVVPSSYSFSMRDSIYSFYSTATFDFSDITGQFLERLHMSKGSHFTLSLGAQDTFDTTEYVILRRNLEETLRHGVISGTLPLFLVHQLYDIQTKKSTAYASTISSIINKLFNTSILNGVDITATTGSDTWYQPLYTDVQFAEEVLLPNAYALNANSTPFFLYTTSDNILHFKSSQEMYTQTITTTLRYMPDVTPHKNNQLDKNSVLSLSVLEIDDKEDIIRKAQNKVIGQINQSTGALQEMSDSFLNYTPFPQTLPLLVGSNSYLTDYVDLGYVGETALRQQHKKSQMYFRQREAIAPIKLLVLTPLNPAIHSGDKVNLEVYSGNENDVSQLSSIFSGNYIVESCEKIWNGEKTMGYNAMVLGRKFFSVPNFYNMKTRLFQ